MRGGGGMEIQINGHPKEIAALVVGLQERQETIESQLAEHLTVALEKKLLSDTPEA